MEKKVKYKFENIISSFSEYSSTLTLETLRGMKGDGNEPVLCLPAREPPPLCSDFYHPEKEEAVNYFQSRFARKETTVYIM